MASYFLISNFTEHAFNQNNTTVDKCCVCCSSQNVYLINLSTCKHTIFLRSIEKVQFTFQDAYVCVLCHNMLKKIESFRQQIQETNTQLVDQAYRMKINKIYNLHHSIPNITDSTDQSNLAQSGVLEGAWSCRHIKPEQVNDIEVIKEETDLHDEAKVEHDSSDTEQQVRLRTRRKNKTTKPANRYEGKIRVVSLTLEELNEERKVMATQPKYVRLPYKCEDCITGFDHELGWKSHMEQRHTMRKGSFQCNICKSVLNSKSSYNEHTKRHVRRLECMACGKRYNHEQSAVQHYDEKHMPAGSSLQRAYVCDCGFTTTVNRSFRYHLDKHKQKKECTLCGNTFVNTNTLRNHMYTVHKQSSRVYRCDACDKTYRTKSGLTFHLSAVHGSGPRAYCAPCRTHYATCYALHAHLATHSRHVTDSDKKFTCDECGAKFVKKCSLQVHITWEHLKLSTHRCPTCTKVFKSASALRRHVSYVHNKDRPPRNKICHYCGRGFTTQTILQSHLRTHTGERPLQCQHCRATFAHSGALYTHIKLKHSRNK